MKDESMKKFVSDLGAARAALVLGIMRMLKEAGTYKAMKVGISSRVIQNFRHDPDSMYIETLVKLWCKMEEAMSYKSRSYSRPYKKRGVK